MSRPDKSMGRQVSIGSQRMGKTVSIRDNQHPTSVVPAGQSSPSKTASSGAKKKEPIKEDKKPHPKLLRKTSKSYNSNPLTALLRALQDPERINWLKTKARNLCNNWRFTIFTTILTVYALFGDDFRLAFTHKRTDDLFNSLTIISILVFSVEIVANSLGQEEYWLGFFFYLDLGSTITLMFDMTWVSDALFCGGSDGQQALKTSRAGRAGARASRTVRIIRLMRLVKLYKAYRLSIERKKAELERLNKPVEPGKEIEDDEESDTRDSARHSDFEVDFDETDPQDPGETTSSEKKQGPNDEKSETRVGKKLGEMTTRRVIILVLVMLVILPMFQISTNPFISTVNFRDSSNFGANQIYSRWRNWCGSNSANASANLWCYSSLNTPNDIYQQENYLNRYELEQVMLRYIYEHLASEVFWKIFWIGAGSKTLPDLSFLSQLVAFNQARFLGKALTVSSDADLFQQWDDKFAGANYIGRGQVDLSDTVKKRLTDSWTESCSSYVGVLIQQERAGSGPTGCSITEELRCSEVEYVPVDGASEAETKNLVFVFAFDKRSESKLNSTLNMIQTVFICFAVGLGAFSFSKDANELLLNPIQRMIEKMETIKDNPLEAMRLGDLEYRREEVEQAEFHEQLRSMSRCWKVIYKYRHSQKVKEPMETIMLEKTIIKLGGLLALGFGEAGAEIIGQNMKGGATAGINATIPGTKVDVIIGYCSIRKFAECTEVLKEKVMPFVNQISEIVHGCIDDFHGSPNKNIGESFLLIWRLTGHPPDKRVKMADMALMSYLKIIAEINKSRYLASYRTHPGMQSIEPGYTVRMGFGLHCGWAIEGALGSEFKIDAAYLSPNVSVAAELDAATSQYKVWILLSHMMVNYCSQEVALSCRLIDQVMVKSSRQAIRLYTIDLETEKLPVDRVGLERLIRNRFKIRQLREMRKAEKLADDYHVWEDMDQNNDVQLMREHFSDEFFQRFAMAYRNYEAGEWMAARDMLFTCYYQPRPDIGRRTIPDEDQWPEDGPTNTLLSFMKRYNYVAPPGWLGYREL
jgi:class 3 adenylate cyclase